MILVKNVDNRIENIDILILFFLHPKFITMRYYELGTELIHLDLRHL